MRGVIGLFYFDRLFIRNLKFVIGFAGVAQLVEQCFRKAKVVSSILTSGSQKNVGTLHCNVPTFFWEERVVGIEPTTQPWEGRVLPLNYTRMTRPLIYFMLKST
ncbi:MAG: hypothetical protein G01um101418_379 [Parcubacteria group bacterium Gr01-1014_18]|nr:MAG: hypothetical protein Greene041636_375 [Parcubacteria group bacterium Greene0416_36]TSC81100.1 MAG: hypothetical protein G01um101418_379 [Parcubacteria group bacterium Gr01-1014_18]TSC98484.1 MAG: hypothetical protein Greene101420_721 [Parcubacteria group bacterium Greene1014_20]TSD07351.1 MAG: hypothetical protein Greene07142_206 [Parcubacteria group bacterium Greene0714_2]